MNFIACPRELRVLKDTRGKKRCVIHVWAFVSNTCVLIANDGGWVALVQPWEVSTGRALGQLAIDGHLTWDGRGRPETECGWRT